MLCWIVVQACKVNSRILLFAVQRKEERNYFSSTQPEHWIRILEEADSSFKTKIGRMILVSSSFRTPSKLVRDAHNFINVLMDDGWHHIMTYDVWIRKNMWTEINSRVFAIIIYLILVSERVQEGVKKAKLTVHWRVFVMIICCGLFLGFQKGKVSEMSW